MDRRECGFCASPYHLTSNCPYDSNRSDASGSYLSPSSAGSRSIPNRSPAAAESPSPEGSVTSIITGNPGSTYRATEGVSDKPAHKASHSSSSQVEVMSGANNAVNAPSTPTAGTATAGKSGSQGEPAAKEPVVKGDKTTPSDGKKA